jgi:predicted nucleic acid-binding protein
MPLEEGRVFLDTNVYIVGSAYLESDEGLIPQNLESNRSPNSIEVIISSELLAQISRVARRLKNKDWAGEIIERIWRRLNIYYVSIDEQETIPEELPIEIPREDYTVYLTAKLGNARYFVSSNHELIRSLVKETQEFECYTPAEFVKKYFI